ncbi:MAG: phosphomannomutase/phosphoglucomutase [Gammaproteobacteria bacterium]
MKVNSEIFRAYDIRGIVDKDLTEEITYFLGKAIGTFIQLQGRDSVITARDGRISGDRLQHKFQEGVLSSGCNVLDIGKVPTPLLYFATFENGISDGVMLTGSHNPKNYNGFKIVLDKKSTTSEKIDEIKSIIFEERFWDGNGKLSFLNIKEQYLAKIKEKIKIKKPLKICLDCGNGIGGVIAPEAFKLSGIELIELFTEVDGNFPNHHPDPSNPKNLVDLQNKVKETKSDLGIALDGDGDRVGLIDSDGEVIYPDRYMMLLVEDILSKHKKGSIVYDVKCSTNLEKIISDLNGTPVMSRTGHSYIKSKIIETDALLGGEMSGHIFFNDDWYGFDDAIYSALRIIEVISKKNISSNKIFKKYPSFFSTPEINISIPDQIKFKLIDEIKLNIKSSRFKYIDIDGVRLESETAWGLVRASNTSPNIVLRFEGQTEKDLFEIKNYFKTILSKIDNNLNLSF